MTAQALAARTAIDAGKSATAKPRPLAYRLHSLFGLKLSLFMAFICATGTIATVSHEIEWALMPQVRASGVAASPEDWGRMWDAAQRAHPEGWVRSLGSYDRSDSDYFAKAAQVALPNGREVVLTVDPGDMAVTGSLPPITFHSFMRGLHYYLFAPGDWGFYAVTALGFVLAGSIATGLIVYRRFWRGLLRRPRFERPSRTWYGDLHRLAAVWSLPFALLIAATSIWYFVERPGVDWESVPPPAAALRDRPEGADIARWVGQAQMAMPGIRITSVSLPWSDGDPIVVQGSWRAWLVRERTDAAFIDPVSGRLLGLRVAHQLPAGERWVHTADPLHFGNFGGIVSKLAWVAFGIALTSLCMTGAVVHAKRLSAREIAGGRAWRQSLGSALIPSVLLILAVPTYFFFSGWDSGSGAPMRAAGTIGGAALWQQPAADATRWCARPAGAVPAQLTLLLPGGGVQPADFEAGRFCADLPAGVRPIGVRAG